MYRIGARPSIFRLILHFGRPGCTAAFKVAIFGPFRVSMLKNQIAHSPSLSRVLRQSYSMRRLNTGIFISDLPAMSRIRSRQNPALTLESSYPSSSQEKEYCAFGFQFRSGKSFFFALFGLIGFIYQRVQCRLVGPSKLHPWVLTKPGSRLPRSKHSRNRLPRQCHNHPPIPG